MARCDGPAPVRLKRAGGRRSRAAPARQSHTGGSGGSLCTSKPPSRRSAASIPRAVGGAARALAPPDRPARPARSAVASLWGSPEALPRRPALAPFVLRTRAQPSQRGAADCSLRQERSCRPALPLIVPSASVAHHGRFRSGGELWRASGRTRAECCFRRRAGRLTAGRRGPPGSSFVVLSGRRGHRLALALLRRPGPPNPPQGCRPIAEETKRADLTQLRGARPSLRVRRPTLRRLDVPVLVARDGLGRQVGAGARQAPSACAPRG